MNKGTEVCEVTESSWQAGKADVVCSVLCVLQMRRQREENLVAGPRATALFDRRRGWIAAQLSQHQSPIRFCADLHHEVALVILYCVCVYGYLGNTY